MSKVSSDDAAKLVGDLSSAAAYSDANVTTQVAQVVDAISNQGGRVLIVSHSQGNLYSNAVYRSAIATPGIKPDNIKVVGVATPAASIQGGGGYLTSNSDVVIGALRLATGTVLPSNIAMPFNPSDISGHLFLKTYMNPDLPAKEKIIGLMTDSLIQIDDPENSYDWLIKQRVSVSGGWAGTEDDAFFIPGQNCTGIFAQLLYCQEGQSTDFLKNSDGNYFDPRMSFYSAESTKALNKLLPYYADLTDINNGFNKLIMSTWPIIGDTFDETLIDGVPYFIYGSLYYDANMNFLPLRSILILQQPTKHLAFLALRRYTIQNSKISSRPLSAPCHPGKLIWRYTTARHHCFRIRDIQNINLLQPTAW